LYLSWSPIVNYHICGFIIDIFSREYIYRLI